MDHFSKFHILWPQYNKTGAEVAEGIKTRVLPYFGLPKIFQSDNGLEFRNEMVESLLLFEWQGMNIKIQFIVYKFMSHSK